jgi:hypothetical protein
LTWGIGQLCTSSAVTQLTRSKTTAESPNQRVCSKVLLLRLRLVYMFAIKPFLLRAMRSLQPILTGSPRTEILISRPAERVQQDGRRRDLIARFRFVSNDRHAIIAASNGPLLRFEEQDASRSKTLGNAQNASDIATVIWFDAMSFQRFSQKDIHRHGGRTTGADGATLTNDPRASPSIQPAARADAKIVKQISLSPARVCPDIETWLNKMC